MLDRIKTCFPNLLQRSPPKNLIYRNHFWTRTQNFGDAAGNRPVDPRGQRADGADCKIGVLTRGKARVWQPE